MVLQKLTLENFQGVRNLTIELPGGCSASIYGDNATGKTTVFNALTWLLFDKASTGAKNFTPKPRGPEGELHHLDSTVTGEFLADDGRVVSFTKTYSEIWKKKRGAAEQEFSGHKVTYFMNGVPCTQNEYSATILTYCGGDPEKPKILTMPDYFPEQMKWEDRRKILLDVCGNVTDADVIASSKELAELPEFLKIPGHSDQLYTIEDYRKIAKAQEQEINRKLGTIPERVDEAEKAIPDTAGLDVKALSDQGNAVSREIAELMSEKAEAAASDTGTAQIRQQIAEKRTAMAEARAAYESSRAAKEQEQVGKISKTQNKLYDLQKQVANAKINLLAASQKLESMKAMRISLLDEYKKTASVKWDPASETCPTCGQQLDRKSVV